MALALSPQVFSIMTRLIEESTGLYFEGRESELLAERLSLRATELGLDSLLEYYYFLRYDERAPRELAALMDLLVVTETYFFREADQLRVLVEKLALLLSRPGSTARIWCAGCSSGEEPLTLAMMFDERGLLGRAQIVATDISSRALAKARAGLYLGRSLRSLSDADRSRHFSAEGDGVVRVHERLRGSVWWQRLNLLDSPRVQALGEFDAILCRNVLIYFRDETVLRLVDQFGKSLSRDGLLLVGASESLLRFGTLFRCEEHGGAFFYRKSME